MSRTNLFVDIGIFAGFLILFEPALTGIPLHEWLSLALAGAIVAHLLLHWRWIVQLTLRFFHKLFHSSRLDYVVDALLFVAFTAMMFSGLLISRSVLPVFGLQSVRDPFWRMLHTVSANASLLLVAAHFALHWNWVVNAIKRYMVNPVKSKLQQPVPARTPANVKRN